MTTKQAVRRLSDAVDRYYGVVPRPRSFDDPAAWPRRNALGGKGRKWRDYYGYSYRPDADEVRGTFPGSAVAAAMVAHREIGGVIVATAPVAKPEIKVSYMHGKRPVTPREHGTNGVDYHVGPLPAKEPEPAVEPVVPVIAAVEVPVVPVIEAPIAEPIVARDLRYSAAAEVLRELATSYGPRRAHKLVAMADFVEAHAKKVA